MQRASIHFIAKAIITICKNAAKKSTLRRSLMENRLNMLIYVIFQEVGLTFVSCVPKNMQIPEKGPAKKRFLPLFP